MAPASFPDFRGTKSPCQIQLLAQGAARSAVTLGRSPSRTRMDHETAKRVGGAPEGPPETAEVTYKIYQRRIYSKS